MDADNGTLQNTTADADDTDGVVGQLNYEYFDLTAPTTVNDIPTIGADAVGTVDPDGNLITQANQGDADNFGIRYSGSIFIATPGEYTFYTTSDDGSNLSIDGTEVVNNDFIQAQTMQNKALLEHGMAKGQKQRLEQMREFNSDSTKRRKFLLKQSMFESLSDAKAISL